MIVFVEEIGDIVDIVKIALESRRRTIHEHGFTFKIHLLKLSKINFFLHVALKKDRHNNICYTHNIFISVTDQHMVKATHLDYHKD